jgi:hypothetical protein
LLFGHSATDAAHNHAGTSVSIDGTTMSTTTAADGGFSFSSVPAGVYTLTFANAKYLPQMLQSIVVSGQGTSNAPAVTLFHGQTFPFPNGDDAVGVAGNQFDVGYSPDRAHLALKAGSNNNPYGSGDVLAVSTGTSDPPIWLGTAEQVLGRMTNGQLVSRESQTGDYFSRAYDGSAPVSLMPAGRHPADVLAVTTRYAFFAKYVDGFSFPQSFWAVMADGSGAPLLMYQIPDANTYFSFVFADDTHFVFITSTATSATLHAVNPSTGVDSSVDFPAQYTWATSPGCVTPDHTSVCGSAGTSGSSHSFIWKVGTATLTLSSTPVIITSVLGAAPDSTGFVYQDNGALWFLPTTFGSGDPIPIINSTNLNPLFMMGWAILVIDRASETLLVASIPTATAMTPVVATLDTGYRYVFFSLALDSTSSPTKATVSWVSQGPPAPSPSPAMIKVADLSFPMAAPPSVINLGSAIPGSCELTFAAPLGFGSPIAYGCSNTGLLAGFTPPFTANQAATTIATDWDGVLQAIANRVVYRRRNGTTFAWDGTNNTLVSNHADPTTLFFNTGQWFFFFDPLNRMSRVSTLDGAVIDEPLTDCQIMTDHYYTPDIEPTLTNGHVWAPSARCGGFLNFYLVTSGNLP